MQEEEYTFVTIDSDDALTEDAVIIVENDDVIEAVVVDENTDENYGFFTLSDETVMLSEADMLDLSSDDLIIDSSDIIVL
ncbi:hypothetical protein M2480_002329 [Parabacteroides sp. PFB2-12]|uniref:hypothetical protein n=1 Tax=unclassified Parabacteroides TaxID=2649774 RepID=UPI00247669A1|nr:MULTISPECIES: hypothetical protein [unclassified Parabacteroides]MDH6343698.1 hypothetical protein [Parabacteroides sp. PM6-13]MDH6391334.1 hypothetical protein [Parabacteroides sp. PFB2-12]